jgi:hypothetical protein
MNDIHVPEMKELSFESTEHIYKLNGLVIPSVSTIMEPLNSAKYANISSSVLSNAADKGTAVHDSIENYIKFGVEDVPIEHKGYFDGFLEWWKDNKPELVGSEIRIYHRLLRYGGTCDLLAYIDGKLTLVDYKTTYVISDMTCGVQLEAYAQALSSHGIKVEQKLILPLKKEGTAIPKSYPVNDAERLRVFGSLKCVYDYLQSYK